MSVESTTDAPEHVAEINTPKVAIEATPEPEVNETEEAVSQSEEETEDGSDESQADESATSKAKKGKGLDKRFAELTREREEAKAYATAQAQKAAELEARLAELEGAKNATTETTQSPDAPRPENFDTYDAYIDALTDYKLDIREKTRIAKLEAEERLKKLDERTKSAVERYADFHEVIANAGGIGISDAMAEFLGESELGPDVAYYLAKNPDKVSELLQMSRVKTIAELGKIEASIENKSSGAETKVSSAPKPVNPIKGGISSKIDLSTEVDYKKWKAEREKEIKLRRG